MGIFKYFGGKKPYYRVRSSRLKNLQMGEYFEEANKIVNDYGKTLTEVMPLVKTVYPAFVFPISALPASKADIIEVFEWFLDGTSFNWSEEERNTLSSSYLFLDKFIADEDAKLKNDEFIAKLKASKSKHG